MGINREQAGPRISGSAACATTQHGSPKVIGATSTRCMMVLLALLAGSPVFSQEASLAELRQRCQDAREQRIAPLREAAIEECASRPRSSRTRADCVRLYADFGEGGSTVGGGRRPPMFMDLPECVDYLEAQDRLGCSGSRR